MSEKTTKTRSAATVIGGIIRSAQLMQVCEEIVQQTPGSTRLALNEADSAIRNVLAVSVALAMEKEDCVAELSKKSGLRRPQIHLLNKEGLRSIAIHGDGLNTPRHRVKGDNVRLVSFLFEPRVYNFFSRQGILALSDVVKLTCEEFYTLIYARSSKGLILAGERIEKYMHYHGFEFAVPTVSA